MGKWVRARCVRLWLLAGVLGASTLPGSSGAARAAELHSAQNCARPALWVVSDADTTIYLFGTIHTHDGQAHWFDHAVRRAFDASDSLVLETIVPAALPKVEAATGTGLAKARETVRIAQGQGLHVELGADMVLHRAATSSGKPVIGLERFADQLDMYRALPSPAHSAAPAAAPAAASAPDAALAPFLRSMVDSWNRGDSAPIEAVVGAVRSQSPEAYRLLFADRNAAWADWIGARMQQPGIVFMAVGTGHLVGSDSVQAKLAARGIRSARIN
jgi:uncharacterized protein YbaP (TraB family)